MKNIKKAIKSERAFTMIELVIVISIMGILSAVIVPSFQNITRNSRLRADINSIKQLQTQIELYAAEHDGNYPGEDENFTIDINNALSVLAEDGYIKQTDVVANNLKLQTKNLQVMYDAVSEQVKLNTALADSKVIKAAGKLGQSDKEWLTSTGA